MPNTNRKQRRKPCPIKCPCLCHDTGGGIQEYHAPGGGPCIGKLDAAAAADLMLLY